MRYRRFFEQLDEHQRRWRRYFEPLVHERALITEAEYAAAPRFTFREEPRSRRLTRAAQLILLAAAAGLLVLAAALARAGRVPALRTW